MTTTHNPIVQAQAAPSFGLSPLSGGALANVMNNKEMVATLGSIMIAKSMPRDLGDVTAQMQVACSRKSMAEKAKFAFPRGGTLVEGESIHLAQMLLSVYGNSEAGWKEIDRGYDADKKCGYSDCVAYCWDKQGNNRREIAFRVLHWRDRKVGGIALTDERDIYEICANNASRRMRACIFAVIPDWLREEASTLCERTLADEDGGIPLEDRIRGMVARFKNDFGIGKERIEAVLRHKIDACTLTELVQLGKKYNAIRDGMANALELFPEPSDAPDSVNPLKATGANSAPAATPPAKKRNTKSAPPVEEAPPVETPAVEEIPTTEAPPGDYPVDGEIMGDAPDFALKSPSEDLMRLEELMKEAGITKPILITYCRHKTIYFEPASPWDKTFSDQAIKYLIDNFEDVQMWYEERSAKLNK